MKFLTFFIIFVIVILLQSSRGLVSVVAQDSDCSPDILNTTSFLRMLNQVYIEYEGLINQNSGDLPTAAKFQKLRRCLDQQSRQPDASITKDDDKAYTLLQDVINLTVDSIISNQVGDSFDANSFMDAANKQLKNFTDLIQVSRPPSSSAGTIEAPQNNQRVPREIEVSGTYVKDLLNDNNVLWLLVLTPNGVYPQASNKCNEQMQPILKDSFANTWTMSVVLGREGTADQDASFRLILVTVDSATNTLFTNWIADSCPSKDIPALTQAEAFVEGHYTVQQVVTVTRE